MKNIEVLCYKNFKLLSEDVHTFSPRKPFILFTDTQSKSTVYRATCACGFDFRSPVIGPFITDETAKKRVEWCKIHKKREWENVFFTDECAIWLNRGTVGIWPKSQENPISKVQRHTPKHIILYT